MSGRHQPEHGADSAEALDGLYIGPIQHDEALIRAGVECWCRACEIARNVECAACTLCHGSGEVMGGDEYHTCPKCMGRAFCSACGHPALLTEVDGKLLCERCAPLPSRDWTVA